MHAKAPLTLPPSNWALTPLKKKKKKKKNKVENNVLN